jgi:thiol-disulfide isomerase/thioredoxin
MKQLGAVCILAAVFFFAGLISADKTGSMEPRPPALLGVVPAPAPRGVLIHKVLPDSSAQRAGLKVGDLILSVNGTPMNSPQQLVQEIRKYLAETLTAIEYERAGKIQTVKIALGVRHDIAALKGKAAPKISLPLYGANTAFAPAMGKVYIIDFWATWCGPCEPVRRVLEDFKKDGKNPGVEIIGITTEDILTVQAFYQGKRPHYPILIDASNDVTTAYHVQGYPTLAVIDRQGVVRFAGFASAGGLETALELARRLGAE